MWVLKLALTVLKDGIVWLEDRTSMLGVYY